MSRSKGWSEAERFVKGRWMMVQQPMVNLSDAPRGQRTSQLLFRRAVSSRSRRADGFAFGVAERDGYVGYILSGPLDGRGGGDALGRVAPRHIFTPKPDFKSSPDVALFFGSRVSVVGERDGVLPHPDRPPCAAAST